jgi:hypothetical protein
MLSPVASRGCSLLVAAAGLGVYLFREDPGDRA